MKAFLWHRIDKVSSSYHTEGSVLIVASDLERAREIAVFESGYSLSKETATFANMSVEEEPDLVLNSNETKERVWVFPDTGCC